MSQASIQILTSNIVGEEPFIGDLSEGELFVNNADGRMWIGDSIGSPIELGGSIKNCPTGSLRFNNFIEVDVSNPDNLPISNTNPLLIPEGYYRESRILLKFPQEPVSVNAVYFDYPVDWGLKDSWFIQSGGVKWGIDIANVNSDADNPIETYQAAGRQMMIELSSFGPSNSWMGRLLWINSIS